MPTPLERPHATARRSLAAAVLCVAGFLFPLNVVAQPPQDVEVIFQTNVSEYLAHRDQLRQGVAPEHIINPHIREISGALLAARIQAARAAARPADIIPAALADIIRDRLHRALEATEVDILLMDLYPDGVPTESARVNVQYDEQIAVAAPLSVLSALPPVPGVLGYRLVGGDVVLWDEEAHLALDVILDALPAPRIWKFLDISSAALRDIVHRALRDAQIDAREFADDLAHDAAGAAQPVVGELFDWDNGGIVPPSVLHALPALPPPLE
jgi:hypothetical protein